MLTSAKAFSSFSTNNLAQAKDFYGEVLGLHVEEDEKMGILHLHLVGGGQVVIYPKDDHKAATFTILNFLVKNIEETVDELAKKGVKFEHYPDFHTDEKGIARDDRGPAIAWFTDPAGNIISVIEDKK